LSGFPLVMPSSNDCRPAWTTPSMSVLGFIPNNLNKAFVKQPPQNGPDARLLIQSYNTNGHQGMVSGPGSWPLTSHSLHDTISSHRASDSLSKRKKPVQEIHLVLPLLRAEKEPTSWIWEVSVNTGFARNMGKYWLY
jgi:hypothetical protein